MLQWKEVKQYISVQTNFIMLLGMSYLAMCNQKLLSIMMVLVQEQYPCKGMHISIICIENNLGHFDNIILDCAK